MISKSLICLTYLDYLTHREQYRFCVKICLTIVLDIVEDFRQPRKMATNASVCIFKFTKLGDCCY